MSLARRFAICLSALIGVSMMLSPAHANAEDLHCHVVPAHQPSAAEKAYLVGNASHAESLYREALAKSPHDASLTAGLVRSLLRQQKVEDAASTISAELPLLPQFRCSLAVRPKSNFAKAKLRGLPAPSIRLQNPTLAILRLYLIRARILRLNSMYACGASRHRQLAHALDPSDIDIRADMARDAAAFTAHRGTESSFSPPPMAWIRRSAPAPKSGLANLVDRASNPDQTCHVVSDHYFDRTSPSPHHGATETARRIQSWGLHILFNNNKNETTLGVDTGASGLLINRAVAERAGLKPMGRVPDRRRRRSGRARRIRRPRRFHPRRFA